MFQFPNKSGTEAPVTLEAASFTARIFLEFCYLLWSTLSSIPPRSRK